MHDDESNRYARGPQPGSSVPVAPPRRNPRLSESTTREWVEYCRATLDDAGCRRPGPNPKREPMTERDHVEYAVRWHGHEDSPAGIEKMPDREEAEHTLRRYADWPGEVVSRTVTVGEWQPVKAAK